MQFYTVQTNSFIQDRLFFKKKRNWTLGWVWTKGKNWFLNIQTNTETPVQHLTLAFRSAHNSCCFFLSLANVLSISWAAQASMSVSTAFCVKSFLFLFQFDIKIFRCSIAKRYWSQYFSCSIWKDNRGWILIMKMSLYFASLLQKWKKTHYNQWFWKIGDKYLIINTATRNQVLPPKFWTRG